MPSQAASALPRRPRRQLAPYLFVTPFLAVFALFGLYPILQSLYLSLYATDGPRSHVFIGLSNYQFLLADPDFHQAVWNTLVFAFWSLCVQLPLALGLALLLNQPWLRARSFLRLAFFTPNLIGSAFVAVLFGILYVPRYGLVNRALHPMGLPIDTKWLSEPGMVMPALVLASLWMYVGFNMVFFLAALQAVDKELYEAARVDGAGAWRQFLAVTLPGIRPVAIFVLVTSTIGSLQLFELPYIMLQGAGPGNSGMTVVMYLYQNGFVTGDLGLASAVGWTLAAGVLGTSLAQLRLTGAWKRGGE